METTLSSPGVIGGYTACIINFAAPRALKTQALKYGGPCLLPSALTC